MHQLKLGLLLAAILAMGQAAASNSERSLDANAIRSQQQQIRADADARKGRYQRLSTEKRAALREHQDKVDGLLPPGVQKTTELNELDRIALFNSLEAIEAIVNQAEDERMVCERYKPTGSKRPTTVCRTVAQRRADNERSMKDHGKRNLECSEASMGGGGCVR